MRMYTPIAMQPRQIDATVIRGHLLPGEMVSNVLAGFTEGIIDARRWQVQFKLASSLMDAQRARSMPDERTASR